VRQAGAQGGQCLDCGADMGDHSIRRQKTVEFQQERGGTFQSFESSSEPVKTGPFPWGTIAIQHFCHWQEDIEKEQTETRVPPTLHDLHTADFPRAFPQHKRM